MLTDYVVTDCGTLFMFRPMTVSAKKHAEAHFPTECLYGPNYCVEHRYAPPIVDDLLDRGFVIEERLEGAEL